MLKLAVTGWMLLLALNAPGTVATTISATIPTNGIKVTLPSCPTFTTPGSQTVTVSICPAAKPLDIVYCVDSSGSIGKENYNQNKVFLKQLTSSFKIGPNDTNVGAYIYGSNAYLALKLSDDKAYISEKIETLQYRGSSTGTDKCIIAAREMLKAGRSGALKVLLVITDGKSDKPEETAAAAATIKTDKVIVFVVGVGKTVSDDELNKIATDSSKVFKTDSYSRLQEVTATLAKGTCDEITSS